MTPITRENLEAIGFEYDSHQYDLVKEIEPRWESYVSENKRYIVSKDPDGNNISYENAWDLHVDNSDMDSIASCSVEYIEQIQQIIDIYKNY